MDRSVRTPVAGSLPVRDEEVAAVVARLPDLIHALKAVGRPPDGLRELLTGGGIGPRHVTALHVVVAADAPLSVTELAGRLGVALPTASLLVAELSRAGLVERSEDDTDRRRTLVRVAPGQMALVRDLVLRRVLPMRRALGRLTPDERAALARGLGVLAEELSAAAGADGNARGWDQGCSPEAADPGAAR